ncbi:hypothetical protein [Hymenobacter tenuis]
MERKIVVVFCNKGDFFLAKICIASIRYYYPDIDIYIVKDYLRGDFSSQELEQAFNVKVLDLGKKHFGWSAAKLHFLISDLFPGSRPLLLDADIIFVGKLLEDLYSRSEGYDFVVDADYRNLKQDHAYIKETYFDFNKIIIEEPQYSYPGYVFNAGQMLVSTGKISEYDLKKYFNPKEFPYYTNMELMPLVDQSILNVILPIKSDQGQIKLLPDSYMLWSDGEETHQLELKKVKEGSSYPYLIHYAGSKRHPHLKAMKRSDILIFFQNFYYSRVPNGNIINKIKAIEASLFYTKDEIIINSFKKFIYGDKTKKLRSIYKKYILNQR